MNPPPTIFYYHSLYTDGVFTSAISLHHIPPHPNASLIAIDLETASWLTDLVRRAERAGDIDTTITSTGWIARLVIE